MEIGKIKAVAFDLDGTLIDTEKYYRACWPKAFAHFGYGITEDEGMTLRSLGKPFIEKRMDELCKTKVDSKVIRNLARELVDKMIKEKGLLLKPGVKECLNYLKTKNYLIAVSTATDLDRATSLLDELKIKNYFDNIISAKTVEFGKPAPDVYLYTCKILGVEPYECIAVEDSPNGAMSAISAGLNVVFVPDQTPAPSDIKSKIVAELDELTNFKDFIENYS